MRDRLAFIALCAVLCPAVLGYPHPSSLVAGDDIADPAALSPDPLASPEQPLAQIWSARLDGSAAAKRPFFDRGRVGELTRHLHP